MIYAIIIIVALAIAFIILIRRLPSAASFERRVVEKPTDPKPKPRLPAFRLPSLPQRSSTPRPVSQAATPPPATPQPVREPRKPIKLPRFSFSWPKVRKNEPKEEVAVPTKEDFWQADATPTRQSVMDQVEAEPKASLKLRSKDSLQQAEDLFAIKDYKRAEKLYLRLATQDPRNAKIYSRLGVIYLEQKNFEDARDALQQAIKLEPHVATRHFNLSLVYLELNSRAKAIAEMEAALKYEPANRKYRKMLDEILNQRA